MAAKKTYTGRFEIYINDQRYVVKQGVDSRTLVFFKKGPRDEVLATYVIHDFDQCNCPTPPEYRDPTCKHVKAARKLFQILQNVFDSFPVATVKE